MSDPTTPALTSTEVQALFSRNEILYPTLTAMSSFGGRFVQNLADTLRVADLSNRARLIAAFPEVFLQYGPGSYFYKEITR